MPTERDRRRARKVLRNLLAPNDKKEPGYVDRVLRTNDLVDDWLRIEALNEEKKTLLDKGNDLGLVERARLGELLSGDLGDGELVRDRLLSNVVEWFRETHRESDAVHRRLTAGRRGRPTHFVDPEMSNEEKNRADALWLAFALRLLRATGKHAKREASSDSAAEETAKKILDAISRPEQIRSGPGHGCIHAGLPDHEPGGDPLCGGRDRFHRAIAEELRRERKTEKARALGILNAILQTWSNESLSRLQYHKLLNRAIPQERR